MPLRNRSPKSGARVAITGRDKKKLEDAAASLGVFPIQADVAVEADVLRTYREVMDKFGDLDILINNAGIGTFQNLVQMDTAAFERVFATNVTGLMMMAREAAKLFTVRNRGNIINIGSTAGFARCAERHGILCQQIRSPWHDGMLARRTPQTQHPRDARQSERSNERLFRHQRTAAERQRIQIALRRDSVRSEGDPRNG